ncbi:MAG: hypothetical protein ABW161_01130 [Candidatus Thiodiazotropha sp.]
MSIEISLAGSLILGLLIMLIGVSLKLAQELFLKKKSDEEVAGLRSEIKLLKQDHNESISRIKEEHAAALDKRTECEEGLAKELETAHKRIEELEEALRKGDGPDTYKGPDSWMR